LRPFVICTENALHISREDDGSLTLKQRRNGRLHKVTIEAVFVQDFLEEIYHPEWRGHGGYHG